MLCVSVLLLVFIFPVEVWIHETMLWTDKVPSGKKYIMVTIVTATDAQVCRHDNCESITDPFDISFSYCTMQSALLSDYGDFILTTRH